MRKLDLRSLKQNPQQLQQAVADIDPNTIRQVQQAVQQYKGKDETQLIEELRTMAAKERANGNLPDAQMDIIVNTIGPMLNPTQRQQMTAMVEQLKQM